MSIHIDKFLNYTCLYTPDISGGGHRHTILFGPVLLWFVYFIDSHGFGSQKSEQVCVHIICRYRELQANQTLIYKFDSLRNFKKS